MEEKLLETVIANTYTKSSFYRRLACLRAYIEKKYFSKSGFKSFPEYLEEQEIDSEDKAALKKWSEVFSKRLSQSSFYKKLEALRDEFSGLPSVAIYLPFRAPDEELNKIGEWLRKNVKKDLVMDVKFDPAMVGGCGLVWKGYYKDYSLKNFFSANRDKVKEMLEGYGAG